MFEYSDRYCEWKRLGLADTDCKTPHFNYETDCGYKIIASKDNKYGKLLNQEESKCPFCKKIIDVRMYD